MCRDGFFFLCAEMGPRRHRASIRLEQIEEVAELFKELGAETSGLGAGVEKFRKQFCKAAEKDVVLYKVMALNLEQKEFNVEQTSIFVKLRESMLNGVNSPELQSSYLEMLAELEDKVPSAANWSLPPGEVVDLLQKAFPSWEMTKLVSVVGVMMSISKSSTSTRSSKHLSMFMYTLFWLHSYHSFHVLVHVPKQVAAAARVFYASRREVRMH